MPKRDGTVGGPKPPPGGPGRGSEPEPTFARPQLVVKFARHEGLDYADGAESRLDALGIGPWNQLAHDFAGITLSRVFTSLSPQDLDDLIARAQDTAPSERNGDRYRGPDLRGAYFVDAPHGTDLDGIAARLLTWDSVAAAYVSRPGPPPAVDPEQNTGWPREGQRYLRAARDGIDSEYAWTVAGGDGEGQRLIDIEAGWNLVHDDLAGHAIPLPLAGLNDSTHAGHGTAVLGVICATDDARPGLGIVPNLGKGLPAGTGVRVVSYLRGNATDDTKFGRAHNIADSIAVAAANLAYGEVLLIEAQVAWGPDAVLSPVEIEDVVYDVVRLATAAGIVVVEAGGNGRQKVKDGLAVDMPFDLDGYKDASSRPVLFRDDGNPFFRDSCAILVTAAFSARTEDPAPNTRLPLMPFGRRIDCYAWGERIWSPWSSASGLLHSDALLTSTSGASAIIAGAALSVQGLFFARYGHRLGPVQMRALLSDPEYGTPPDPSEPKHIGVMPDLRKIIDVALGLLPLVYMRDFVGDAGLPHTGDISSSPDVILRSQEVADPQAAFGAGSGQEDSQALSTAAVRGRTNYVYVRVRNRGGGTAANVFVVVYWAPVSTLVTPEQWTEIGMTQIDEVPSGDVLTVSPAIEWPATQLPPKGHYCFVAVARVGQRPPPPPDSLVTMARFRAMIRNNNDVTWRNFNVVENTGNAAGEAGVVILQFRVGGAPREPEPMQFVFWSGLPDGAEISLVAPLDFVQSVLGSPPHIELDRVSNRAAIPLPIHGSFTLGPAPIQPGLRIPMQLRVRIPAELRRNAYELHVRQLWRGDEVGRVTWRLVPLRA